MTCGRCPTGASADPKIKISPAPSGAGEILICRNSRPGGDSAASAAGHFGTGQSDQSPPGDSVPGGPASHRTLSPGPPETGDAPLFAGRQIRRAKPDGRKRLLPGHRALAGEKLGSVSSDWVRLMPTSCGGWTENATGARPRPTLGIRTERGPCRIPVPGGEAATNREPNNVGPGWRGGAREWSEEYPPGCSE